MQEEVANVIEGLGTPLDKLDNKQLLNILTATFAKNTALQNAINDYNDKFLQQNSRVLALENRVYEYIQVGELFITSIHFDSSAQVAIHKGYGTWAREAEGRAIVGYSSLVDSTEWTKTNGTEYGEDKVQLTIEEIPSHAHDMQFEGFSEGSGGTTNENGFVLPVADNSLGLKKNTVTVQSNGGNQPHNNVQPSKVYNIWKRIA